MSKIIGNSSKQRALNGRIGEESALNLQQSSCRVYWKTRARTRGHGQADTDARTRTLMEKTGRYGKDGHLWKRRAVMEKTGSYGKDGHLWKRRTQSI